MANPKSNQASKAMLEGFLRRASPESDEAFRRLVASKNPIPTATVVAIYSTAALDVRLADGAPPSSGPSSPPVLTAGPVGTTDGAEQEVQETDEELEASPGTRRVRRVRP